MAAMIVDLKAIEAHLGRRLTRQEVERLRDLADRARLHQCFESALAALRQADPAAVSRTWGTA
jgi:hypothetical protein